MNTLFLISLFFISFFGMGQTAKSNANKKAATTLKKNASEENDLKPVEVLEIKNTYLSDEPVSPVSEEQIDENTVYTTAAVEVTPEFPGGISKLSVYLEKNIVISDEMKSENSRGKVIASFIVEKDGSITDIKILREVGFGIAKEAVRVLKMMPRWRPAQLNGKNVRCSFTIPISINASK